MDKKQSREEWLKNLKSDKGTPQWYEENKDNLSPEDNLVYQVLQHVEKHGVAPIIAHGAYGPEEDTKSNAWIEKVEFPKEGGSYVKYYGCPFRVKGISFAPTVKAMQFPKYMFAGFIKDTWKNCKLIFPILGILWLVNRNGLLKLLDQYLWEIIDVRIMRNFIGIRELIPFFEAAGHENVAWLKQAVAAAEENHKVMYWPESWYNKCEAEIHRCLIESSKGEGIWESIFARLARFFRLFLFIDNTYKSRSQDALAEGKDIYGTLDIFLRRENVSRNRNTFKFLKYILWFALLTSPSLKRIITKFFKNLDREKVKMDEDDWYFASTYRSYNFRDLPYPERRKHREEMNKKFGVVLWPIVTKQTV